ncbi:hypothetical protein BU23DRAFT_571973 [Bimuria novae-zelandiae CBS 107.79]|uniref:Uncharacterized protein n=1 Tax=Bimuria novae-zelandiae CBS 107.79 TaxID=1447943 RepID=A0A6A5UW10_9PLEO|nr:hypothetical protein BU23DRAFT_571973 [Bimuria novae-zelandiae CBS 107.79]
MDELIYFMGRLDFRAGPHRPESFAQPGTLAFLRRTRIDFEEGEINKPGIDRVRREFFGFVCQFKDGANAIRMLCFPKIRYYDEKCSKTFVPYCTSYPPLVHLELGLKGSDLQDLSGETTWPLMSRDEVLNKYKFTGIFGLRSLRRIVLRIRVEEWSLISAGVSNAADFGRELRDALLEGFCDGSV